MTKQLTLTKGKVAIIDDEDYERFGCFKYHAVQKKKTWYAARRVTVAPMKSHIVYLHREIMQPPDGMRVDHIDRDGLNNRRRNLRVCTHAENLHNTPPPVTNTSGYKGVSFNPALRNKWVARIRAPGVGHIASKGYRTAEEAAAAFNEMARKYHGEFAYLNELETSNG